MNRLLVSGTYFQHFPTIDLDATYTDSWGLAILVFAGGVQATVPSGVQELTEKSIKH